VALNKEATLLRALNDRFHKRIFQVLTGRNTSTRDDQGLSWNFHYRPAVVAGRAI